MVRLVFKNGQFTEGREESGEAMLILDETTQTGKLEFSPDTTLISRRTTRRQAESICKSGYLLATGRRVGAGYKLQTEEERIDDRLLQEGHHYR